MSKTLRAIVISNRLPKTLIARVERTKRHPIYGKTYKHEKKYYVHHEHATVQLGQKIEIQESRPLSKLKRWKLKRILST